MIRCVCGCEINAEDRVDDVALCSGCGRTLELEFRLTGVVVREISPAELEELDQTMRRAIRAAFAVPSGSICTCGTPNGRHLRSCPLALQ